MKLGFLTVPFGHQTLEEVAAYAKDAGFSLPRGLLLAGRFR